MPSTYEAGLIESIDGFIHAVRNKINGPHALCGAGRIARRWPGRFDPADARACPECTKQAENS